MSTFHVYVHTGGDYEAIPDGFSIPAVLGGGAWALSKRLWKIGILLVALDGLAVAAMRSGGRSGDVVWMLGGLLLILAAHGLAGMYGAYWRENSMNARGFIFVATVTADAMETAIQRAMREERTPSAEDRDPSSIARRAAIAPEPLAPGMTGTRFEMDLDRLRDPGGAEASPAEVPTDGGAVEDVAGADPSQAAGSYRAPREDYRSVAGDDEPPRRRLAWVAGLAAVLVAGGLAAGAWYYFGHRTHDADGGVDAGDADAGAPPDATASAAEPQPTPTPVPIPVPTPIPTPATPAEATAAGTTAPAADDADGPTPAPAHARPLSPAEIEAAWARHYKPAAKCIEPADWDTYVECVNTMMREREAFAARLTKSPGGSGTPAGKGP